MAATKTPQPQTLERARRNEWSIDLYQGNGNALGLADGDTLACRVWDGSTDGATPYLTVTTTAGDNGSVITINSNGTANVTPANVTLTIEPEDASLCTLGNQAMEITVTRAAASGKPYVVCRCVVNVVGSPA